MQAFCSVISITFSYKYRALSLQKQLSDIIQRNGPPGKSSFPKAPWITSKLRETEVPNYYKPNIFRLRNTGPSIDKNSNVSATYKHPRTPWWREPCTAQPRLIFRLFYANVRRADGSSFKVILRECSSFRGPHLGVPLRTRGTCRRHQPHWARNVEGKNMTYFHNYPNEISLLALFFKLRISLPGGRGALAQSHRVGGKSRTLRDRGSFL